MTLRVNLARSTRADYLELLKTAGLTAYPASVQGLAAGLTLDRPVPTAALPGFADGLVSVQDAGAQLAAELLNALPGERILDACAAPGGKSANMLERAAGSLDLTCVDSDAERLAQLENNLQRLGLRARAVQGDAAAPHGAWANQRYDRILLDAPCSATGVIRRHPDIKWLRREGDVGTLSRLQARMLDSLWPLLIPGGRLLYCTCSVLAEENEMQIRRFLSRRDDAEADTLPGAWGETRSVGRQILPRPSGPDGFYYAALTKSPR